MVIEVVTAAFEGTLNNDNWQIEISKILIMRGPTLLTRMD